MIYIKNRTNENRGVIKCASINRNNKSINNNKYMVFNEFCTLCIQTFEVSTFLLGLYTLVTVIAPGSLELSRIMLRRIHANKDT